MPRKYPLCALCGESVVGQAYVIHEFRGLPGKPIIGWHFHCHKNDMLAISFKRDFSGKKVDNSTIQWRIDKIAGRGTGRVTMNKMI